MYNVKTRKNKRINMRKRYSFRFGNDFEELLNKAKKRLYEENKHLFGSLDDITKTKTIEFIIRMYANKKI